MKRSVFVICLTICVGCGFNLKGRWNGTGETGERSFFDIDIDFSDTAKPLAVFSYKGAEPFRLPVCAFKQQDKHIEFKLDLDGHAPTCDGAVNPYSFVGDFGADVLTGQVLDSNGNRIGIFRAFRVVE